MFSSLLHSTQGHGALGSIPAAQISKWEPSYCVAAALSTTTPCSTIKVSLKQSNKAVIKHYFFSVKAFGCVTQKALL